MYALISPGPGPGAQVLDRHVRMDFVGKALPCAALLLRRSLLLLRPRAGTCLGIL